MNILRNLFLCMVAMGLTGMAYGQDTQPAAKVRVVNFKTCVEKSKIGKQEQSAFDTLKKQMESNLSEKEKVLNEMAAKFEDPDYMDSLSPEAETEVKRTFRKLNQEYSQLQSQYLQALQQTNYKVIQKLTAQIEQASATLAKRNNIDIILNSEGSFFVAPQLDISSQMVAILDEMFDKDSSNKPVATSSPQ